MSSELSDVELELASPAPSSASSSSSSSSASSSSSSSSSNADDDNEQKEEPQFRGRRHLNMHVGDDDDNDEAEEVNQKYDANNEEEDDEGGEEEEEEEELEVDVETIEAVRDRAEFAVRSSSRLVHWSAWGADLLTKYSSVLVFSLQLVACFALLGISPNYFQPRTIVSFTSYNGTNTSVVSVVSSFEVMSNWQSEGQLIFILLGLIQIFIVITASGFMYAALIVYQQLPPLSLLSVYLSILLLYTHLYFTSYLLSPSRAFTLSSVVSTSSNTYSSVFSVWLCFLYLSSTILTTVGVGDIVPRIWYTKIIAVTQMITAVVYTAYLFSMALHLFRLRLYGKRENQFPFMQQNANRQLQPLLQADQNNTASKKTKNRKKNKKQKMDVVVDLKSSSSVSIDAAASVAPSTSTAPLPPRTPSSASSAATSSAPTSSSPSFPAYLSALLMSCVMFFRSWRRHHPKLDTARRSLIRYSFVVSCVLQLVVMFIVYGAVGNVDFSNVSSTNNSSDQVLVSPGVVFVVLLLEFGQFFVLLLMSASLLRQIHTSIVSPSFLIQCYLTTCIFYAGVYFSIFVIAGPNAFYLVAPMSSGGITIVEAMGQSIWMSIVLMTTTGFGDTYPLHPIARLIVVIQMLCSEFYSVVILGLGMAHVTVSLAGGANASSSLAQLPSSSSSAGTPHAAVRTPTGHPPLALHAVVTTTNATATAATHEHERDVDGSHDGAGGGANKNARSSSLSSRGI